MEDILVICRNCGEVERYSINYMTPRRKEWHNCYKCGNRNKNYKDKRRFINVMIKKNYQDIIDLINQDKYNNKLFGIHKGFDFKIIKENN